VEPLTWEVVGRSHRATAIFSIGWLRDAEARFGDPRRLALTNFGPVVAATAPTTPDLDFMNRVYGLGPERIDLVPEILEHYRQLGLRPWFELPPHVDFDALSQLLAAGGCRQIGFYSGLAGRPVVEGRPAAPTIEISVAGVDDSEGFAALRTAGHQAPQGAEQVVLGWPGMHGVTTYLAWINGEPVGTAALLVHEGVGYLADASTIPVARGQGVQSALIARRIADAASARCDLVTALAAPYSTSHHNLERGGLRLAYQLAVWRAQA
jgi:GNAT superfamily N-acetyltransferase